MVTVNDQAVKIEVVKTMTTEGSTSGVQDYILRQELPEDNVNEVDLMAARIFYH